MSASALFNLRAQFNTHTRGDLDRNEKQNPRLPMIIQKLC